MVRFEELINRVADQERVPREVAQALVDTENAVRDPTLVRMEAWGGGSYGLTQITLRTARSMGFAVSGNDLGVPETNVRAGLRYLRMMFDGKDGATEARGSWIKARAAYNAGPDMTPWPEADIARFTRNLAKWRIRYGVTVKPPGGTAPPTKRAGLGGLGILVALGALLPWLSKQIRRRGRQ